MKVYCFTNNNDYGGGCAIVIANSPIEALGVLANAGAYNLEQTDLSHCEELNLLIPDESVTNPILVTEHFYTE